MHIYQVDVYCAPGQWAQLLTLRGVEAGDKDRARAAGEHAAALLGLRPEGQVGVAHTGYSDAYLALEAARDTIERLREGHVHRSDVDTVVEQIDQLIGRRR